MEAYKRKHQLMMLDMLYEIHRICTKHSISYMLYAGSALGAVRHQGFIPWDDDLDVAMMRPDYERFLEIASEELDTETYFLQKEFSEHWPMFFSKLRRNGTACIERYIAKDPKTHMGIYIDIFPCDNLSDIQVVRKIQFLASKVVIAKSLDRRGYLTDSLVKKAFMRFCRLIPRGPVLRFVQMKGGRDTNMVHCFLGGASRYESSVFPRAWISDTILMPFEGGQFPVSGAFHEMLTKLYGDYMVPLPEEKRGVKVHAELVDLENSYESYIGCQQQMRFKEYSRSIR